MKLDEANGACDMGPFRRVGGRLISHEGARGRNSGS